VPVLKWANDIARGPNAVTFGPDPGGLWRKPAGRRRG
jgi:hypothetical protein